MSKRFFFLSLACFIVFSCQKRLTSEDYDGYAVTGEAYDITTSTAVLTGEIFPSKKDLATTFRVAFLVEETPLSPSQTPKAAWVFEKSGADLAVNGKFEHKLTGLKSGTEYYYTVWYSAGYGRNGERKSFTTKDIEVSVVTDAVTDINSFGATLHGHFISDLYYYVRKVRFMLKDSDSSYKVFDSKFGKDGKFSTVVTNLASREFLVTAWAELYDGTNICGETIPLSLPEFPETVDLGLSVKWRNWNVGAKAIHEIGDFFAWGETAPKDEYTLANYNTTNPRGDAAATILGNGWRMPTIEEWKELADPDNCTWSWVELLTLVDGSEKVRGFKIEGKNGNWILLPAGVLLRTGVDTYSGGYWSSDVDDTLSEYMVPGALGMFVGKSGPSFPEDYTIGSASRYMGYSVRAVKE